jgi:hypothetical protein
MKINFILSALKDKYDKVWSKIQKQTGIDFGYKIKGG